MRFCEIDFPEALLSSQKDNSLAVFAGAGVSVPPPSNYPDFKGLANQVAGGVLTLGPDEPIDHFLGRLKDRGTNVHQLVGQILTNPKSKPNSIHYDLLRLFPSSDSLRLVTTNFDPHFSSGVPVVFPDGKSCEIYYAPALPLGDSFSGIVYLHGGVEKPFERMVLTDSDFGRAYLTEGWARVFLQRLFETYSVLFVGYGHNDPVMNYLARGLPSSTRFRRRFALTSPGQEENWIYRGIIPITYGQQAGDNPHASLPPALAAWSKNVRLGALEQEQRIKAIVNLPPPIDPEDADFMVSALSEPQTTRFFTRHANTIPWLKWVEEKKLLKRLFDPSASLTEVDIELGDWFVERFVSEHVGESFSVLRRQGQHLSPYLWNMVAHRLLLHDATRRVSSQTLHRWLAVLLNSRPQSTNRDLLEMISTNLVFPEDKLAAMLLFEYLTRPMFRLKHDLWSELQEDNGREDVKFELATHGGGFWLNDFWTRFFSPNLAAFVDKLEPIVTSHLQQARTISLSDGKTDPSWDSLSFSRNMIERSDQGAHDDGLGVLVDAGLAIVQWNAKHRPSRLDALIELWFATDSFLLKRLAILAVCMNDLWNADRKLTWILTNWLTYTLGLKHEVFEVLKVAYPHASSESRKALLERALQGPQPVPKGGETTAAYETYNLVYWLHQSDPECELAKNAFNVLQAAHPEFGKREHPDLDVDFSEPGWIGEQSPATVEDLLSKAPKEQLEYLRSFVSDTPFGPSREGLLGTIGDAAARKYEWGFELATQLEAIGAWDADLLPPIIRGWSQAELSDEQWKAVLGFLDDREKLHIPLRNEISWLLEEGIKKTSQPIPNSCLGIAVDLSKKLWAVLVAAGDRLPDKVRDPEWVGVATNHPAGNVTRFWLSWLVRERKRAGSSWQGLPAAIKEVFDPLSTEPSYAGELARVLLASQLNLLSSADAHWAKEHVLPLFDFAIDGKRAVQAFHGFLTWGRQTENLLVHLVPLYEKAFARLSEMGKIRGRFTEYLAGLALAASINPVTHGWLNRFVSACTAEDRFHWASQIRNMLRGSTDAAREFAWASWIKRYWAQRILGVPLPLDPQELGEMVEWTLNLGPNFPEVVDSVWVSPRFELKYSSLFRDLAASTLPQQHPTAAAKLLLKVLRNVHVPQYDLDKVEDTVRRIAALHAPLGILKDICNELAKLGYLRAADLLAWVEGGGF